MAAVVGSLTWAYFSDTATTTATFSTGTVDLQICNEQNCSFSLDLPEMADIYPGWEHTVTLGLKNVGSLAMNVSFQASEGEEDDPADLGSVIEVAAYASDTPPENPLFPGTKTINDLEGEPVTYGELEPAPADPVPITFVFTWPETGENQTGFAGASLDEEITFYGTTEGVEQD